eukprot:c53226_g1_i1.p1 GENE.c53226_g1_i1~~c53226_g1_i1.p1  ORF type:complete len:388 (+),score=91.55 c53226_g1_i1:101-1165(+)
MTEIRTAERTGRIRAEKSLRELKATGGGVDSERSKSGATHGGVGKGVVKMVGMCKIGEAKSCFMELNGTPWQPHACPSSKCIITLSPGVALTPHSLDGLSQFSHVWILFHFDRNTNQPGKLRAKVSPPRDTKPNSKKPEDETDGGKCRGLFATRTPHRPNAIGLSVCRLVSVDAAKGQIELCEVDIVDGTTIFDIKPYVPHYDSKHTAIVPNWIASAQNIEKYSVEIEPSVLEAFGLEEGNLPSTEGDSKPRNLTHKLKLYRQNPDQLLELVKEVLQHDIRRANKKSQTDSISKLARKVVVDGVENQRGSGGGEDNGKDDDNTHSVVLDHVQFTFRIDVEMAVVRVISAAAAAE